VVAEVRIIARVVGKHADNDAVLDLESKRAPRTAVHGTGVPHGGVHALHAINFSCVSRARSRHAKVSGRSDESSASAGHSRPLHE